VWPHAPLLERIALVVALAGVVLKATVAISAFPAWELDPFTLPAPFSGLGPAGAMMCDAAICLGAALLLLARFLAGQPARRFDAALVACGAVGVIVHQFALSPTIGDRWIGSAWLAAMILGLAVASASTPRADGARGRVASIVAAVFLGLVALLAIRGVEQVFIDHPATLADFKRNRDAIFAAQGWSPDSPMAKAYERRLSQPEATGWFGLANVYATLAAAGTVAGGVLLAGAFATRKRAGRETIPPALVAGAALVLAGGAGGLALAGAKGGVVAAGLGALASAALLSIRPSWRRSRAAGGIIGAGALAATFSLVILRGLLADRINELSLLFRWFYMEAAVRIGVRHLPFGVGPDGFQRAYTLLKNPLSPEDVTSSHNILLDWFATLGIFGLAWIFLWIIWTWRAGAAATMEPPPVTTESDEGSARADRWCVAAIGTIATLAAIRLDSAILSPDLAIVRLAGVIAFCAVGWIVLALWPRLSPRWTTAALAGGAIAAAAHGLIDVTGVWPGSCGLLALLVGAAAGRLPRAKQTNHLASLFAGALAVGAAIACLPWSVQGWERGLRTSGATAEQAGYIAQRWTDISAGVRSRRPGAIEDAKSLAAEIGSVVAMTPRSAAETGQAVNEYELRASRDVAHQLEELARRYPTEWKLRREASRAKLREASILRAMERPKDADAASVEAERIASAALPETARTASDWAWVGLVRESLASGDKAATWGPKAAEALEEAAKLAPYEPEHALRLMRLYDRLGNHPAAQSWAARALALDSDMEYDREVKGLSPQERDEARRLAGGS
jgi:hypothetical protein